jgi:hypothetical protein
MINPTAILAIALAFLLSIGGAYFKGKSDGHKIQEGEQALINRVADQAYLSAQKGAAIEIGKIKVTNTTITQKMQKEIYEKPVYLSAECRNTPDGLQFINAALAGTAVRPGNSKLPRIESAR